ncbi:PPOX class probable FMN-dependent enzyme [Evansella vedderi]|uniref:PPOX class probable FMN-dependent enzyme n=1 Tax=Evansella vedderi TaxID=38282 RepID=A0ABT9ZS31_9BACI|nr:pyridoxamine 5'-phosphate oxidase family protein [Evansella vedderi]MDQ0254041.1 PPOX class probable FMN-dependent enzyme [Evansella vedderi]
MGNHFHHIIQSEAELLSLLGEPSDLAKNKVITSLDEQCIQFLNRAPFLVVATSNREGQCDVSPRGDAPGFVYVIDEKTILIPERKGNKRADSMKNILETSHVGLQFFIPGLEETLRINGEAVLITDIKWLEKMEVQGQIPAVAIAVTITECFIHCAKAFKRSELWKPSTWPAKDLLPNPAKMLRDHANMKDQSVEAMEKHLQNSYKNDLY